VPTHTRKKQRNKEESANRRLKVFVFFINKMFASFSSFITLYNSPSPSLPPNLLLLTLPQPPTH